MPGEDKCHHDMIRDSCSYCQAEPEYKIEKTPYEGVIEIKHKGNSITEFDRNFMFGRDKVRLFLACMDIVEELANTPFGTKPNIRDQTVVDDVSGDEISVELKREIKRSSGERINIEWVRLQSGSNPDVYIGFGRRKAKAVSALKKELADWVGVH
jgi:hypothetical protein